MILLDLILGVALLILSVKLIKPVSFGLLVIASFPVFWIKNIFVPEKRKESLSFIKAFLSPIIIFSAIILSPYINAYKYRAKYPFLSALLFGLTFTFGLILFFVKL